jgi:hypothetical protein
MWYVKADCGYLNMAAKRLRDLSSVKHLILLPNSYVLHNRNQAMAVAVMNFMRHYPNVYKRASAF